ncbi:MAG: hypothetical protein HN457_17910 [Opitutales bacterium]|nr:hypothetical protein [Opitutales bacterium]MBT7865688.1 hypothetical protein [Opitutales bacterium]
MINRGNVNCLLFLPDVTLSAAAEFPDPFPRRRLTERTYRTKNTDIDHQSVRLAADYFIGH